MSKRRTSKAIWIGIAIVQCILLLFAFAPSYRNNMRASNFVKVQLLRDSQEHRSLSRSVEIVGQNLFRNGSAEVLQVVEAHAIDGKPVTRRLVDCEEIDEYERSGRKDSVEIDPIAQEVCRKLNARSPMHGWQQKGGMLEADKWTKSFKLEREKKVNTWFKDLDEGRLTQETLQPPIKAPGCIIVVNHHYKFIWIKGKKVGGTSLRDHLGQICGDFWKLPRSTNMSMCGERIWMKEKLDLDKMRSWWKDYMVFGFVRNPYTRFVSSYKYIETLTAPKCPHFKFNEVCGYPFAHSNSIRLLKCASQTMFWHHAQHMMEQASCLFTRDGQPAVDYIGHSESLTDDFQIIAKEINKRIGSEGPHLNERALIGIKNASHRDLNKYPVELFQKHPQCLAEVEKHFALDFSRLKYTT